MNSLQIIPGSSILSKNITDTVDRTFLSVRWQQGWKRSCWSTLCNLLLAVQGETSNGGSTYESNISDNSSSAAVTPQTPTHANMSGASLLTPSPTFGSQKQHSESAKGPFCEHFAILCLTIYPLLIQCDNICIQYFLFYFSGKTQYRSIGVVHRATMGGTKRKNCVH